MPARLYHQRITVDDATPPRWLLLTHGFFGAGSNWRGIARKLVGRRPEWGVVLVDLRQHGRSEKGEPPHTLAACADDLRALITDELGGVDAMAGHSFGGKVVATARPLVAVRQTWLLDASPSTRPDVIEDPRNSILRILAVMERGPTTWARREDFVAALLADGHSRELADWLAMNVVPDAAGTLRLRLDTAALREMLADYCARDLWTTLATPAGGDVEVVVADRSPVIDDADRARLATMPPHVHTHHIDADHWLHIEAPAAVVELFATRLPSA